MPSNVDEALSIARGHLGDDVTVVVPLKPRQRFAPVFAAVIVVFAVAWFAALAIVDVLGSVAGSILVVAVLVLTFAGVVAYSLRSATARLLCRRDDGQLVLLECGVIRTSEVMTEPVRPPLRAGDLDAGRPVPVEVNGRKWTVVPRFIPQLRMVLGVAPTDPT